MHWAIAREKFFCGRWVQLVFKSGRKNIDEWMKQEKKPANRAKTNQASASSKIISKQQRQQKQQRTDCSALCPSIVILMLDYWTATADSPCSYITSRGDLLGFLLLLLLVNWPVLRWASAWWVKRKGEMDDGRMERKTKKIKINMRDDVVSRPEADRQTCRG